MNDVRTCSAGVQAAANAWHPARGGRADGARPRADAICSRADGISRRPDAIGPRPGALRARRGFSLIEVLLAVFILGIGMIMVASVFPVGANWTRQTTEESMGQVVAQTALSVINAHYGPGGDLRSYLTPDYFNAAAAGPWPNNANPGNTNSVLQSTTPGPVNPYTPFTLQAFPNFLNIPVNERAYQFIKSKAYPAISQSAFPVADPTVCTYFWTALVRLNPSHMSPVANAFNGIVPTSSYKYDVYILVYHKGLSDQQFSQFSGPTTVEVPFTRGPLGSPLTYIPSVYYTAYNSGTYTGGTPAIQGAVPQIGEFGIGAYSGTVFRQGVGSGSPPTAFPQPQPIAGEPIIYSPPADNTTSSPLIYVYQTTLSF